MTYTYFIENTTNEDNIDNSALFQFLNKINLNEDCIYADKLTEKVEIRKLFGKLKAGDTLLLRSIQDTANNVSQLLKVLVWLVEKEIEVVSIMEPDYTYSGIIKAMQSMDEYYQERNRVLGFEEAKKAGKIGRPHNPRLEEAIKLYQAGKLTVEQITAITKVPASTLYRGILKANKAE